MNAITAPSPVVAVRNVTKRFPGVLANDRVSLAFHAGEVHVLLGENGAGKSTLIGILAGMQQPDEGEILIDGQAVRIGSPRQSLEFGIGTVFQHVLLVPSLSVIENLMLGGGWWGRLVKAPALARFRELSTLLGVAIDPDAIVGRLSLGEQQQVEIMRALWRGEKVLILDEPTSMLTPQGVRDLGEVIKRLRAKGVAVILITHKLLEAYEFGDRISVLRLGRVVGDIPPERLSAMGEAEATDAIIELMFGKEAARSGEAETLVDTAHRQRQVARDRAPRLTLRGVSTEAARGECPLREVSFELWPGEVLGIAGVDGNGQKHLAEVLAGQRGVSAGRIELNGGDITGAGVPARRQAGIRYVTDERLGEGTVGIFSVATNLVLKEIGRPPYWSRGWSDWDGIHGHARDQIGRNDIRTPSERTPVAKLSGGNIQKVLLAREINSEAQVVVFNKPTYGLDLQNTRLAHERIIASADHGIAIVVISTDLDELIKVSDRIGVMFQGRLAGIVENGPDIERRVGLLMTGVEAA
ncbi:nucleoside ABC transporter ATP-binding protein [Dongia mobilis]|uniref:Nucleoside ABC transporter ATP-binding protein n=1 Tax=Dongia mobilis TaxID=578943 RepID=A0A4R6WN85_9PROT|nr:ABC transporter ATP-binding protein [Dongia mobilis]TDQ80629.1 nucleoside ABC transporter ATP-binding protein [Dongia mobilis]